MVDELVRQDLKRRGLLYTLDPSSGCYAVQMGETRLLLSVENLAREYEREHDVTCVGRFLDSALSVQLGTPAVWTLARKSVLFCLEPTDYAERPEIRTALSEKVDRVPALLDDSKGRLTWISASMLNQWGVSIRDVETAALENIASALASSSVEWQEIDTVRLGFFNTPLPFKSPLLLAP